MIFLLLTALFVKHFIADFLYQPPYQWQNKGTYGHPGGYIHAGQHALLTFLILLVFGVGHWMVIIALSVFELILHYHIDWVKMRINAHYKWGANTHNQFWILLGLDQLLHSLTYVAIAAYITFLPN